MRKTVSRLKFSFRFAFKNLTRFRLRSILLILSFIALFVSLLLGFSTRSFVKSYYFGELENKYREIDFSMGTSLNSHLRYFSIRPIYEAPEMDDFIEDFIPFFEIDALIEINQEKLYVKTISSSIEDFQKISNMINHDDTSLGNDEVIITNSMADTYHLNIGDTLQLYVKDSKKDYTITDIIQDGGLFQDQTIYLDKENSLSFFLTALNPSLSSLNPSLLVNIYNQVYFSVKSGVTGEEALNYLSSIPEFSSLQFKESIDENAVNQQVRRITAFFNLINLIAFLAIFLVMQTTFMLYFEGKRKDFAVIDILGGKRSFSYSIVLIEISTFFVISIISSIFIAQSIIQNGLIFVGSSASYNLEVTTILLCICIAVLIYLGTSFYYFFSLHKQSSIHQTMNGGTEKQVRLMPVFSMLVISLLLYLLMSQNWIGEYTSIIQSISAVFVLFSLAYFLIFSLSLWHIKNKKTFVFSLHIKVLLSKKSFYQYTSVLLVCFMSIFLLVFANDHMNTRIQNYSNELIVDLGLTNFISRYETTYEEISTLESVDSITKVTNLQSVDFVTFDQTIPTLISMDSHQIASYFNLVIPEDSKSNLENTQNLIILLPERFRSLYSLQVGDIIRLDLSPTHSDESFEIGGFFEKEMGDLAFTNLNMFDTYEDIRYNMLFINAKTDKDLLKNELINLYSKNMVYIIDFDAVVGIKIQEMQTTTHYLTIILSAIIGCFVLSIFNHSILLLEQMKDTYARFFVLGFSKKRMLLTLVIEDLIVLIILLIASIIGFFLLSSQLSSLVLILGEYEFILVPIRSYIFGSILIFFVFLLTKIIYTLGVFQIKPSGITKTY